MSELAQLKRRAEGAERKARSREADGAFTLAADAWLESAEAYRRMAAIQRRRAEVGLWVAAGLLVGWVVLVVAVAVLS